MKNQIERAEPSTTHVYKFDRLRNGTKMAEGATISRCSNPEDAQKKAAKLFGNHPYESFVLQEVDGQPVNEPRAEPSRGGSDAHPCPKCGYEMCQQFDDKPGPNEMVTLAVPNGKYICYRHPASGEVDCKCNCNPHCGCECHAGHVVLLEALRRLANNCECACQHGDEKCCAQVDPGECAACELGVIEQAGRQ